MRSFQTATSSSCRGSSSEAQGKWTEESASDWVQYVIRASLESCPDPQCFYDHPVLYEFNWDPEDYSPHPPRFKKGIAELASETPVWDAWFFENCPCWLVALHSHEEDNHGGYQFYAWENGYVESYMYGEDYGQ
jgi:hypothetical protein